MLMPDNMTVPHIDTHLLASCCYQSCAKGRFASFSPFSAQEQKQAQVLHISKTDCQLFVWYDGQGWLCAVVTVTVAALHLGVIGSFEYRQK